MAEAEEDRHLKLTGEFDCDATPLATLRHSTSHVMAQAVKRLWPDVKVAIGPAIEDGFYYDFARSEPFMPDDLAKIEGVMGEIVKANVPFERQEMPRADAIAFFRERGERYKVEILEGLDVPTVSLYRQGDFIDLCRGPHVGATGAIKAFKLLSSSGAYWRGDEKNPMLRRIYGTAWLNQEDLDKYLWRLEEAKKRDHRKLGRELDLFAFHDVSPGAPFWLPNGWTIVRELEKFVREVLDARGYQEISTPILVNKKLWEQSGHWEHFRENMFLVESEEQVFSLKPMNCPESTLVYRHALRSYRDLPLRFSDMGRLHRNERSGTLSGLFRVRQFTQDDAHIYCRLDQVQDEITGALELIREWYKTFEIEPFYKLSTRPEKSIGTAEQWETAEKGLADALHANDLRYDLNPGDGAFYGPKIDVDIAGRAGTAVAGGDGPGGLRPARSLRARVHRRRRPAEAAGDDPSRDLRLVRAVHRHPHRTLRGRVSHVARAGAGARAADQRKVRRLRARRARNGCAPRTSAPSWTTATRSSAIASATPRYARFRTCSWSANGSVRPARSASVPARATTSAPSRSTVSSPTSRARSPPVPRP